MKANEVRIGNWTWRVYAPYGHEQSRAYNQINLDDMKLLCSSGGSFTLHPIHLSVSILDNSGLAKSNEFDMWYGFDHRLCIEKIHGGWLWCIDDTGNNEGSIQRPVAYVHQLQNIVYWVFNKELDIKL